MTHTNEQERAEVICTDQGINVVKDDVLIAFIPWEQAARRAQVVPQGVQVQDTETKIGELLALARIMVGAAIDASSKAEMTEIKAAIESEVEFERTLRNIIDAAPQPPDAAPVQMPEASGLFSYGAKDTTPTYHHEYFDKAWLNRTLDEGVTGGPHRCEFAYTEHQVRQLLASHGIK